MTLVRRRRGGESGRGEEVFQQLPHSSTDTLPHSYWVRIPRTSLLITSAVFVVFVLDMAKSGYGKFVLIPDLRPQITTLTDDIRSDLENLTRSKSLPTPTQKAIAPFGERIAPDKSNNCQTLLDSYKTGAKCHFEPTNYSNISH
jgi:hypothetical protein